MREGGYCMYCITRSVYQSYCLHLVLEMRIQVEGLGCGR